MSVKNSNVTVGNRTRDLPNSSAERQRIAPLQRSVPSTVQIMNVILDACDCKNNTHLHVVASP